MKKIDEATQKRLMNITSISLTLGLHRHTVRRHIQVKRVMPLTKLKSVPMYDFAEVAKAIYGQIESKQSEKKEVAKMSPEEAIKYYKAELARLKFENEAREYCHVDEVRAAWNEIQSSLIGVFKSFPGNVEVKDDVSKEALLHITTLCELLTTKLSETSGIPASAQANKVSLRK